MKRRTLLQWLASTAAMRRRSSGFACWRSRATFAAWRSPTLHEVAPTVLPSSLGAARDPRDSRQVCRLDAGDTGKTWRSHTGTDTHGCRRRPRRRCRRMCRNSRRSPATRGRKGGSWSTLDLETRRALLDAAFTKAGVRSLPPRPAGQHVVADLMAFYFRSSEANDECYRAMIQREVCRPIAITIRRPEPLAERR